MKIDSLNFKNFRNLIDLNISPCDGVNIIYGENGVGKTNIVEGIWLFSGNKSFRGVSEKSLINTDKEKMDRTMLSINFHDNYREQNAEIILSPQKKYSLNEIEISGRTALSGKFYAVIFSPIHLELIKNGPEERRRFLDTTICQIKPKYRTVLNDFHKVIYQRNHLLKSIARNPSLKDTLEVWDTHLARLSVSVAKTRYSYLEKLKPHAKEVYAGISRGKEELFLNYKSQLFDTFEQIDAAYFKEQISKNISEDLKNLSTTIGIHKDDMEILLDDKNARQYASQGQQRSIVLSLKLSECEIIKDTTDEKPIVLLDDVMGELDLHRKSYLLNELKDGQIFITCCDAKDFKDIKKGKAFYIKDGDATEVTNIN